MSEAGHVIITDDETTFLHATADLLRREGYEVDCAENAAGAVQLLNQNSYNVLITDIRMPGNSDDLEFVREVGRLAEGMPVILVTGYPSMQTAMTSIELPVVAYLVKPFDFAELSTHVRASVERHRSFQIVRNLGRRLEEWQRDLTHTQHLMKSPQGAMVAPAADSILNMTLGNILGCLAEVNRLPATADRRQSSIITDDESAAAEAPEYANDGSGAQAAEMRKALERLASDLEEFGIVTRDYSALADLKMQKELKNLSPREWEILRQLRAHQRVGTIARSLHLSPHTVRNHLKSIFRKVGVHSQEELLKFLHDPARRH